MSSNPRVDLSLEQLFRLQDGELTLEELFADDDVYAEPGANLRRMLRRARYKVLQGFRNAVDDKLRPTDNYIMNCGPSCDELVAAIAALTKQGPWLVRRSDLSPAYRNLPEKRFDAVVAYARKCSNPSGQRVRRPSRSNQRSGSRVSTPILVNAASRTWRRTLRRRPAQRGGTAMSNS